MRSDIWLSEGIWHHTTGCSRWMCRILDWYGDYAFRLWEILKWFPSHTDVYIWLSSEMFGIFRWIKSEKLFFPIFVKNDQFLKKFDQNWKQKFFLIFLYQNKCTLGTVHMPFFRIFWFPRNAEKDIGFSAKKARNAKLENLKFLMPN